MPNVLKYGILNLLETFGPVQACNGIACNLRSRQAKPSIAVFYYYYYYYYNYAVSDVTVNYPFHGPHYLNLSITVRHKLTGLYKQ